MHARASAGAIAAPSNYYQGELHDCSQQARARAGVDRRIVLVGDAGSCHDRPTDERSRSHRQLSNDPRRASGRNHRRLRVQRHALHRSDSACARPFPRRGRRALHVSPIRFEPAAHAAQRQGVSRRSTGGLADLESRRSEHAVPLSTSTRHRLSDHRGARLRQARHRQRRRAQRIRQRRPVSERGDRQKPAHGRGAENV